MYKACIDPSQYFTRNKIYLVLPAEGGYYEVVNDLGNTVTQLKERFQ